MAPGGAGLRPLGRAGTTGGAAHGPTAGPGRLPRACCTLPWPAP